MLSARLLSRLREVDWDFSGSYSESRFSAIHWHPCRYASQLPAAIIGLLSKEGDTVLDPFVGSGTTLVESQRLGRRSIGIDVNPISCLITRAKTLAINASTIIRDISVIRERAALALSRQLYFDRSIASAAVAPKSVQAAKWYTSRVGRDLRKLWGMISTLEGRQRLLAEAAFSAILLRVCRETRHWGYVCDNSTPQGDHEEDVLQAFCVVLDDLSRAYDARDADIHGRLKAIKRLPPAKVLCGDAVDRLKTLPVDSVNLIVTSPPYFGVCDYTKAQRLSAEWFDIEIEPLRRREIGARSKRHRQSAVSEYLSDLAGVFEQLRRCTMRSGVCALVIGQSQSRTSVLRNVRTLLCEAGFTNVLDLNRTVSSQRRQAPSVNGEHVIFATPVP